MKVGKESKYLTSLNQCLHTYRGTHTVQNQLYITSILYLGASLCLCTNLWAVKVLSMVCKPSFQEIWKSVCNVGTAESQECSVSAENNMCAKIRVNGVYFLYSRDIICVWIDTMLYHERSKAGHSTIELLGIKAYLSPVRDNLKSFLSNGSIAFSLCIFVLYCETQNLVTGKVNSSFFWGRT